MSMDPDPDSDFEADDLEVDTPGGASPLFVFDEIDQQFDEANFDEDFDEPFDQDLDEEFERELHNKFNQVSDSALDLLNQAEMEKLKLDDEEIKDDEDD